MIVGVLVLISVWNFINRDTGYFNKSPIQLADLLLTSIYTIMNHVLFYPFLGDYGTSYAGKTEIGFWVCASIAIVVYTRLFFKTKTANDRLIYLALVPFLLIAALSWVVRTNAFNIYFLRERVSGWYYARYALNLSPIALILALSQLPRLTQRFNLKVFYAIGIAFILQASYNFEIIQYSDQTWAGGLRDLLNKEIDCSKTYYITATPTGWKTEIQGKTLCEYKFKYLNN